MRKGEKILSNDQKKIRKKLEQELAHLSFSSQEGVLKRTHPQSSQEEVLKRTHPQSFQEKVQSWWNKEVTLSLVPVGVVTFLLISATIVPSLLQEDKIELPPREIIQVGGNFYWSDLYEEARNK